MTKRMNVIAATCISQGNTGALCCAGCDEIFELGTPTPIDPTNHVRDDNGNLMTEIRNATAATCAVPGNAGDVCCTQCGAVITPGESLIVAHTEVADEAIPANCGYPGKTAGSHCAVCGLVIEAQQTVPATGSHTIDRTKDKHIKSSGRNCQQIGYSQTCYECSTCHKYFANYDAATELSAADVEVPGNHDFSEKHDILCTPRTCQHPAEYYWTCKYCGIPNYTKTPWKDSVNGVSGHNYVADYNRPAIAPTCLGDGSYYKSCSMCGEQSEQTEQVTGSRLGHDYSVFIKLVSEATCAKGEVNTYKCSRCSNQTDITGEKDPNNHPEGSITSEMTGIIAPTCTAPGEYYVSSVCHACGKILAQNEYHHVDPLPHSTYTVPAKAATCTADGNITYYVCNNCGRLFRDAAATQQITRNDTVVPALGHNDSGDYVKVYSVQTTCTVDGKYNMVRYCANGCGKVMGTQYPTEQTEPKFDHRLPNGDSAAEHLGATPATCTEPAREEGERCTICNAILSGRAPVAGQPALGHNFAVSGSPLAPQASTVQGFFCSRCGIQNPDMLGTYNALVNAIKSDVYDQRYTVSLFGRADTVSNYNKFRSTGIVNILSSVKEEFDAEMKKTETEYNSLMTNKWIKWYLHLKPDPEAPVYEVSKLESRDVSSITVQELKNGVTGSQIIGNQMDNAPYDLSAFRSLSVSEKVIAVTVTIKNETYTPAGGVSGVGANELTAMQKFNGKDIRAAAAQYGENGVMEETEEDSGYSMVSRMALKNITSGGSATFYFKASNYQPIAAVYDSRVTTSQDVSMTIRLGISSGSITVDPYVTESMREYFIFSGIA